MGRGRSGGRSSGSGGSSGTGKGGGGGGGGSTTSRVLSEKDRHYIASHERSIANSQKRIDSAKRSIARQEQGGAVRRVSAETMRGYRSAIKEFERDITYHRSQIEKIRNG